MSYSTIKAVAPGQAAEDLQELRNSHGTAPHVWKPLCEKYLGESWIFACDKLWPLWKDERLPLHQRAVLALTFDHAYVAKKDYARAAADIRAFFRDFPIDAKYVNHWPTIAELLESDPEHQALAFVWTSCGDDLWLGEWDEAAEDYGDIDWSKTWSLYDAPELQVSP